MRRISRLLLATIPLLLLAPTALAWQTENESPEPAAETAAAASEEGGEESKDDSSETAHDEQAHAGSDAGDHGSGHGDDHVDLDPTHGNVSDVTYEVVDFRTDMAFFSAIVFLLLLLGLSATAWKPIMQGLEKRELTIAGNMADAEKANREAQARLAEYESKLAAASEEAAAIVSEARKDAEATGQKVIAEAQEEAQRLRERATADIESAKHVALLDLAHQSTDVAMSLAQRVVGREVKAEDHQSLIQDMLAKLPSKN